MAYWICDQMINEELLDPVNNFVVRHEVAFMIVSSNQGGNG